MRFLDWLQENKPETVQEWLKDADETGKKSPKWLKHLASMKSKVDRRVKKSNKK